MFNYKFFQAFLFLYMLLTGVSSLQGQPNRVWTPLAKDKLHDPTNPALFELQQPREALKVLPYDYAGNKVNWIQALREGIIQPRSNIYPGTETQLLDLDLIYTNTGDRDFVRFPHLAHTEWLDCTNCHPKFFKKKYGATKFNMLDILYGESCGRCHGKVAFPISECNRCHSVNPDAFYNARR